MSLKSNVVRICATLLLLAVAAPSAIADCQIGSADVSCAPGTPAYGERQAQAQRDQDLKKMMEGGNPENQRDPNSPYYLGTIAEQCAAAKRSLLCQLGGCETPFYIANCEKAEAKPVAHHQKRHHY